MSKFLHNANNVLVTAEKAKALDAEASADWGLEPFALVEAAGRSCAAVFAEKFLKSNKGINYFTVLAGSGNNAADALVMLKTLILDGYAAVSDCQVIASRLATDNKNPLSQALLAIQQLGVQTMEWDAQKASAVFTRTDYIIDGVTGTGLKSPLRNVPLEIVEAVNCHTDKITAVNLKKIKVNRPIVVSIDVPSGNYDDWQQNMPILRADATLAIEPQKLCLYTPAARSYAGMLLPVTGIFPSELSKKYREADLVTWKNAVAAIPPISKTVHKYERGLVEIWAGSQGAIGAAKLAAEGAQAAGAGLIRLVVDSSIYPVVASGCSGVMAVPSPPPTDGRFTPTAVLLGPGWGKTIDRVRIVENFLSLEEQGTPLILDADAIALAKDMVFHGNAIMTPHMGEFEAYSGLNKDELTSPIKALRDFSAKAKAVILLKSHVIYVAAPDGRIGIIDGMNPILATGGTGDVLAGFCSSIAARWKACVLKNKQGNIAFDAFTCACAAGALLMRAANSKGIAGRFVDPVEITRAASAIAGKVWLEI